MDHAQSTLLFILIKVFGIFSSVFTPMINLTRKGIAPSAVTGSPLRSSIEALVHDREDAATAFVRHAAARNDFHSWQRRNNMTEGRRKRKIKYETIER
jgi:hypothetical protein|tara:strand:+ start:408 stop:701 length:294 start_codon:yes stop_codon:yes gene_type:complete